MWYGIDRRLDAKKITETAFPMHSQTRAEPLLCKGHDFAEMDVPLVDWAL
jgi:hypothetical protein